MNKEKFKKVLIFVILTTVFITISLFFRDLLITTLNNFDFKLFTIDYIKNYGAAFSLFHTQTSLLIIISTGILLLTLYYIIRNIMSFSKQDFLFSSMLCAGIICNLSERLLDGYVTDYIRLNMVSFPIFNISDLFICVGAFVLICNILFSNEQQN